MDLKDFGLKVAKARIKENLSAYELSLRIGKDASYIHKLENGKVNVTLNVIFKICEVLKIEPIELFKSE
ncbi:MAG: helix-turn-helix domain-containing protein [Clostridia bacterium]|nr:helix-turn-helix domain-containing protein [Clostridia bacterium]